MPVQQRWTSAIRASAEWKPNERWLIRRILLLRPSRRPFESPRRIATSDASAVLAKGAGEPDQGCPDEPGVEMGGRERRIGQVVEQPQLLAQEKGAVEAAVGVLDFPERGELADRLMFGGLQQRPAGALDPATVRRV